MVATAARPIAFQGLTTRVLYATPAQSLIEHELAPGALGSPLHTHSREDEVSYVLAGRLGAQVGERLVEALPGDTLVKPRGVAHAFWNPGDDPVRFVELVTPGGFEAYFADVAPVLGVDGAPDMGALAAIAARYGLDVDPASVPALAAAHDLLLGGCRR